MTDPEPEPPPIAPPLIAPSQAEDHASELRRCLTGAAASLLLTGAAFGLVWLRLLPAPAALIALAGLAILQAAAQFRWFLHVDLRKSHRDDLHLILFTALVIAMMVGGTVWILWAQHARM